MICGDFLQLPPVPKKDDNDAQLPAVLAFEAKAWCRCVGQPVILKQVFRQKDQGTAAAQLVLRILSLADTTSISLCEDVERIAQGTCRYGNGLEPQATFSQDCVY